MLSVSSNRATPQIIILHLDEIVHSKNHPFWDSTISGNPQMDYVGLPKSSQYIGGVSHADDVRAWPMIALMGRNEHPFMLSNPSCWSSSHVLLLKSQCISKFGFGSLNSIFCWSTSNRYLVRKWLPHESFVHFKGHPWGKAVPNEFHDPNYGWCPSSFAKLVYKSNFTMVFVGDISIVHEIIIHL